MLLTPSERTRQAAAGKIEIFTVVRWKCLPSLQEAASWEPPCEAALDAPSVGGKDDSLIGMDLRWHTPHGWEKEYVRSQLLCW